jgi:hypothetical protein
MLHTPCKAVTTASNASTPKSPSAEDRLVRAFEGAGIESLSEYQGRHERQESIDITRRHQALETEKQHAHRVAPDEKVMSDSRPTAAPAGELKKNTMTGMMIPNALFRKPAAAPVRTVSGGIGILAARRQGGRSQHRHGPPSWARPARKQQKKM